jgi:hypothetical protein
VQTISQAYLPVGVEHDPRIPPLGRVASGFVRERPDGEYEAIAVMELFDSENDPEQIEDSRELLVKEYDSNGLTVSYDRTYNSEEDQSDIAEIAAIFENDAVEQMKKSVDPVSLICVAGSFALGAIASGFFGQIGADGWNIVKKKLADLFSRTENQRGEQLLVFRVVTNIGEHTVEIEAILTNPTYKDIDRFLAFGMQRMDVLTSVAVRELPDMRRLVFEVSEGDVVPSFAVLKNCRSLKISLESENRSGISGDQPSDNVK